MDITLDTTPKHRHLLSPRSRSSTFGPLGAPVLPDSLSCSLAERHTTAGVVFSLVVGVASSAAAFRLRQPLPAPPVLRVSTARPGSPRARTVALGPTHFHPREVGPALPGRRVVPAPAASLSSLARPPPPPVLLQARGGVALLVEELHLRILTKEKPRQEPSPTKKHSTDADLVWGGSASTHSLGGAAGPGHWPRPRRPLEGGPPTTRTILVRGVAGGTHPLARSPAAHSLPYAH